MNKNKLDETNYTAQLAGDINFYVKTNSKEKPQGAYTPHATKQSFKNINESSCFDLLYKITNSSLLVLEIKVTHDGNKLHSFNTQQRVIDSALCKVGIPLDYCYNIKDDFSVVNDASYTLQNSMGAHPEKVADDAGNIHQRHTHVTLKNKIDHFLKSQNGNAGSFGALFTKGLLHSLQQVNTKLLFFSVNSGDFDIYTLDDICEIYQTYEKSVHLAEGLDLKSASLNELAQAFASNAKKLKEILDKKIEYSNDNQKPEEDSRFPSGLTM